MRYVLDTNICIYWLKGDARIAKKIETVPAGDIAISFITLSELYYGAFKSARINENLAHIGHLREYIPVIDSNQEIARLFGKIKTELAATGKITDDADIFIAACCLDANATLVTNNTKHFENIGSLTIENWRSPL